MSDTDTASSKPGDAPVGKSRPDGDSRDSSAQAGAGHDQGSATPPPKKPGNEEPVPVQEADLPSDGRDEMGEAMIRDLPQRPELSEPPSRPGDSQPQT
jgi:hypothetical protein